MDSQTDRRIDRQTGKRTETDRQTDRQTDKQTKTDKRRQTDGQTDMHIHRQTDRSCGSSLSCPLLCYMAATVLLRPGVCTVHRWVIGTSIAPPLSLLGYAPPVPPRAPKCRSTLLTVTGRISETTSTFFVVSYASPTGDLRPFRATMFPLQYSYE